MQFDVEGLRRNDPQAVKQLLADCRTCTIRVAARIGATSFIDDIAQDMTMVILGDFLDRYEPGREVQPFLTEMARRMGLKYYNRHSREQLQGDDHLEVELEEESDQVELDQEQRRMDEDAQKARSLLMERMQRAATAKPAASAPAKRPSKPIVVRKPSEKRQAIRRVQRARAARPEVQELVDIRRQLGLTQTEMAIALNEESPNKVRTVEYGVVLGEVATMLAKARELLENHRRQLAASEPISEHLARWCRRLGLQHDDFEGLANRIGVHRSTIYRWRVGDTSPKPHQVRQLDALVEALCDE